MIEEHKEWFKNQSWNQEEYTTNKQIERIDMEKTEKWMPPPTRKHIFINQETGLLYERLASSWFNMIPQKMTEHQELESFRKADGVVRMTSRSRVRVPPPSDQTLTEESE